MSHSSRYPQVFLRFCPVWCIFVLAVNRGGYEPRWHAFTVPLRNQWEWKWAFISCSLSVTYWDIWRPVTPGVASSSLVRTAERVRCWKSAPYPLFFWYFRVIWTENASFLGLFDLAKCRKTRQNIAICRVSSRVRRPKNGLAVWEPCEIRVSNGHFFTKGVASPYHCRKRLMPNR